MVRFDLLRAEGGRTEGLLRGVRVDRALQRFGEIWGDTSRLGPAELYGLSQEVDRLDDFISHDWETGRWIKWLALCYLYNATAAVLATVSLSTLLALLMLTDVVPKPAPTCTRAFPVAGLEADSPSIHFFMPLGSLIFWVVLCFWQQIRSSLCRCRPRMVFVDKVCISQIDSAAKRRGILKLAGFLAQAERLVVMLSPRYLTRVWCVFELATWLKIHGCIREKRGVEFMPVVGVVVMCLFHFAAGGAHTCMKLAACFFPEIPLTMSVLPCLFLGAIPASHWMCKAAQDLYLFPQQVSSFSIRDAKCFCCTHNHVDPVSREPLACDRELIYMKLREWFPRSSMDEVLDTFDSKVRSDVGRSLEMECGGVPLRYIDALFFSCPQFLYSIDVLLHLPPLPLEALLRAMGYYFCIVFCIAPNQKLWMMAVFELFRLGKRWRRLLNSVAGTLLLALFWTLFIGLQWLPLKIALEVARPEPFWCLFGIFNIITGLLYHSPLLSLLWLAASVVGRAMPGSRPQAPEGDESIEL